MARTFRFISQDDAILENLDRSFKNYRITAFHFELLTPAAGNIMQQKVDYSTKYENSYPVRMALTNLVIKHAPKWYFKYMDIMPIKVTKLEIVPWF